MRGSILLAALALTACTTLPHRAAESLIGQPRATILACLGVPDQREVADGQEVLVWRQLVHGPTITIPTLVSSSLSVSAQGECHAVVALREGRVVRVTYTGPATGLAGPDADCAPIVRGCVDEARRERTAG